MRIKMKKLLITGFEPFGGEEMNPSWEAVKMLPDTVGDYSLTKLLLPVAFGEAASAVLSKAADIQPDAILCIGQAGGRAAITPELVGINLRHAKIPDNKGFLPTDEKIDESGSDAHFSTIPVRKIAAAIAATGIASDVSYSAGAYVCNDTLYTLLSHYNGTDTRVGFIHIPYSKEQGKEPCMDISDIVRSLCVAIENID